MIHYRFPIFILQSILLFAFLSCETKDQHTTGMGAAQYKGYLDSAEQYNKKQQYDSAFYYFNQAKLSAISQENSDRIIYALIRMSDIQKIQSDFSGSEATATEALDYFKNSTVKAYPAVIYNTLGMAYKGLYDYDNAVKYFNKSLDSTTDELSKSILRNNIAVVYMDQKNYAAAIQLLEPQLSNPLLIDDRLSHAKTLDNLGYARFKANSPNAFSALSQSLAIREKEANDYELVPTYLHLCEFYQQTQAELARAYALKAYQSATKVNSVDDRIESLKVLVSNTVGTESKKYAVIHMKLTDSIVRIRQMSKNQFAKIRYDDTRTREENTLLKYEKEKMNLYIVILIGIAVILVILIFFIRYRKREKHKREKIEVAHETEIRISRKIHDELANDIYNTITFTETQDLTDALRKETLLQHLDSVYERARDISRENSAIDTDEQFPLQLRDMLTEYNSSGQKVILRGFDQIQWNILSKDKKVILYRILQELMVNMKKHSHAQFAVLQFEGDSKQATVRYSDNGVGADLKNDFSKNGLRNVENRILVIGGTFTFDSEPQNGMRITISFPLEN